MLGLLPRYLRTYAVACNDATPGTVSALPCSFPMATYYGGFCPDLSSLYFCCRGSLSGSVPLAHRVLTSCDHTLCDIRALTLTLCDHRAGNIYSFIFCLATDVRLIADLNVTQASLWDTLLDPLWALAAVVRHFAEGQTPALVIVAAIVASALFAFLVSFVW